MTKTKTDQKAPQTIKHVVMYSGGAGSWAAAKLIIDQHGPENVTLLFADTHMEDEDLYRFTDETVAAFGAAFVKVEDEQGRTPWDIFFKARFLGNSRIDPCSQLLKRQLLNDYLAEHFDPATTIVYMGMDASEGKRWERCAGRWNQGPWTLKAPLVEQGITKQGVFDMLDAAGIKRPRLYDLGFSHNNCGGFCCKAGQGHFLNLLKTMPDRFAYHEQKEQELRDYLGKNVAMLRISENGARRPLTLRELREKHEATKAIAAAAQGEPCRCAI